MFQINKNEREHTAVFKYDTQLSCFWCYNVCTLMRGNAVILWSQRNFAQRHRWHRVYEKISDPVEPEKIHTEI